jgi:hypothetical protein
VDAKENDEILEGRDKLMDRGPSVLCPVLCPVVLYFI